MSRYTDPLIVGSQYDRKGLTQLWNLGGIQAIARGVFTPRGENSIFLFVTRDRESWMTQYNNFLDGDLLFWDGETKHGSDERIKAASNNGEDIYLFYRENRVDLFTFYGRCLLRKFLPFEDRPSQFVFEVPENADRQTSAEDLMVGEQPTVYSTLSEAGMDSIDKYVQTKSRGIAQRIFRGNLLRLWQGSCAVTGVHEARVLRSSHIKPWNKSEQDEKFDHFNGLLLVPNLDVLLDQGLISFRNDGRILISNDWKAEDKKLMHMSADMQLREVHSGSHKYLEYHRDVVFRRMG